MIERSCDQTETTGEIVEMLCRPNAIAPVTLEGEQLRP